MTNKNFNDTVEAANAEGPPPPRGRCCDITLNYYNLSKKNKM